MAELTEQEQQALYAEVMQNIVSYAKNNISPSAGVIINTGSATAEIRLRRGVKIQVSTHWDNSGQYKPGDMIIRVRDPATRGVQPIIKNLVEPSSIDWIKEQLKNLHKRYTDGYSE